MPSGVHDSAFIVNAFRAREVHASADRFAPLWVSEETRQWADQYAEKVGSTEVLVHALRHRFFLERLTQFIETVPDGVFINIGAGFTNYPYLIPAGVPCCEIDTEENLQFKTQKLAEFELNSDLPVRTVKFIAMDDLNDLALIAKLEPVLKEWINNRPSFVLFEGVFFYLEAKTISRLLDILASLQHSGDIIASTSFRPEECYKPMFQRLVDYCGTDYKMRGFTPTTVPTIFYRQQPHYSLVAHENYYRLGKEYGLEEQLSNPEEVLEEDCYILERR